MNRISFSILLKLGFFVGLYGVSAFGQVDTLPEAKIILDRYRNSLSKLQTISMKVNCESWRDDDSNPNKKTHYRKHDILHRRDHSRIELIGQRVTFDIEGSYVPGRSTFIRRLVNNENHIILYFYNPDLGTNRPPTAKMNSNLEGKFQKLLGHTPYGGPLDGYLFGSDHKSVADLLSNGNLQLHNDRKDINNVSCWVLEAVTEYGKITAWIAPDYGYNALKWTIQKTERDLFRGNPLLAEGLKMWVATFEADEKQKIKDVFVITGGLFTLSMTDKIGKKPTRYHKFKRTEVDLNPDFEALGAFQINLPEGTVVTNEDIPGIKFVWSNGKLVPYINKPAMKQIDKDVGKLLKEKVSPKYGPYAIMEESNGAGSKRKCESLTPPMSMTVSELLTKYQVGQNRLRSFIAKSKSTFEIIGKAGEISLTKKTASEFRYDGSRVNCRVRSLNDEIPPCKARYESFVWDGKSFIEYQQNSDSDKSRASVSRYDSDKNKKIAKKYNGAALMGICCGDYERIDLILSKARFISLQNKTDTIGGSECYVIEANTKRGKYKVWIDPEHGYNIARIEVQRNKRDLINYMESLKAKMSFSLKNVRFEKINDVWVPMEADIQQTEDNGNKITRWHHKRIEFVLNPDHNTLESFVPDDIPDGTMVELTGDSKKYEWQKGRPIALAEPRRLRRILPSQKDDTCVWRAHE